MAFDYNNNVYISISDIGYSSLHIGGIYFWLGGTDETTEGEWEWVTGSCSWEWSDWGPNYDGNTDQNCLCIRDDLYWNDGDCTQLMNFICEF